MKSSSYLKNNVTKGNKSNNNKNDDAYHDTDVNHRHKHPVKPKNKDPGRFPRDNSCDEEHLSPAWGQGGDKIAGSYGSICGSSSIPKKKHMDQSVLIHKIHESCRLSSHGWWKPRLGLATCFQRTYVYFQQQSHDLIAGCTSFLLDFESVMVTLSFVWMLSYTLVCTYMHIYTYIHIYIYHII